jgi:iron-sulfur cluster repair protein YtfE (RIC family)
MGAEEIYLYPMVRTALPGGDDIAEHEISEHDEAEQTMKRLEALTPDQPTFWPTVRTLVSEVRHHVAEQENSLFPQLRAACSEEPTSPHPSSPSEGSALAAVVPGAGLVDRVRDALSGRGG